MSTNAHPASDNPQDQQPKPQPKPIDSPPIASAAEIEDAPKRKPAPRAKTSGAKVERKQSRTARWHR